MKNETELRSMKRTFGTWKVRKVLRFIFAKQMLHNHEVIASYWQCQCFIFAKVSCPRHGRTEAHLRCMKNEAELRSVKRTFGTQKVYLLRSNNLPTKRSFVIYLCCVQHNLPVLQSKTIYLQSNALQFTCCEATIYLSRSGTWTIHR